MSDEPTDKPASEDPPAERRRVRRRRSSKRSRGARGVQTRLPFTGLRFTRPRLPSSGEALLLACAFIALGLSTWSIGITGEAGATLTQTRALLAMNTRGATVGRLAADRLAAEARADAAQMMAAQDMAERQANRPTPLVGLAPGNGYVRSSQDDQASESTGLTPQPYGASSPYGQAPYGQPYYGQAQPSSGSSSSANPVMGYTLPQAPHP